MSDCVPKRPLLHAMKKKQKQQQQKIKLSYMILHNFTNCSVFIELFGKQL